MCLCERGFFSWSQGILHLWQTNLKSNYLKMTFKLFNFSLSIFVLLSLFSLSWSVSLKAKISEKMHFFASKRKKIRLIFAFFRFKRKWVAHPSSARVKERVGWRWKWPLLVTGWRKGSYQGKSEGRLALKVHDHSLQLAEGKALSFSQWPKGLLPE